MPRYHVNPTTGNAGACKATKKCPFGGDDEHFETEALAREFFESKQANSFINKYDWPENPETRTFKSANIPDATVTLQVSGDLRMGSTTHKLQAWLTTPDEGNVAFVCMLVHNEKYYEGIGDHLVVCDIETRPDQRGKGFAREIEASLAKETAMDVYYSGGFTPEGWKALGKNSRYYPHMTGEQSWDAPGEKFNSMGFVASWKDQIPRYPDNSIEYSDEQRDAMYELHQAGVFKKLDDKEMLWAEE